MEMKGHKNLGVFYLSATDGVPAIRAHEAMCCKVKDDLYLSSPTTKNRSAVFNGLLELLGQHIPH